MNVQLIVSLIVLALIGFIDSVYLYWHSVRKKPLVCPINEHDCNVVVQSKWRTFFGIKNDILGIVYYLVVIIVSFTLYFNWNNLIFYAALLISFGALLFSIFLVYLQKYVIKEYCFYCLISALVSLLIFINLLII